jgi:membrane protease YdiL (CAAX protease family)
METNLRETSQPEALRPIASPWHTVVVLIAILGVAYRGYLQAATMRAITHPDHIKMYERTILFEWLTLAVVLAGLWLHGSHPLLVLGERWRSVQEFFRDIGIGLLFLVVTIVFTSMLGGHGSAAGRATQFLLPETRPEMALWFLLSLTAGICEEALYRGYLQKQFIAMTKTVPVGIVLSALVFGLAHSYQGPRRALTIAGMGAMAGALAYWRHSLRPGMIAHVVQDILGAFIRH